MIVQGRIMVPAGPEAWKRLPASRKTFAILILFQFVYAYVFVQFFSYDFVYVKNNNYNNNNNNMLAYKAPVCQKTYLYNLLKTTEVETLYTCNVVYYI